MPELWDKRAKQFLVIAGGLLILAVLLKFAKYFADILVIIGISILIAYLLIGPVDFLTRIIRVRAIAVTLTFILLISFLITALVLLGPQVAFEFKEFTKDSTLTEEDAIILGRELNANLAKRRSAK